MEFTIIQTEAELLLYSMNQNSCLYPTACCGWDKRILGNSFYWFPQNLYTIRFYELIMSKIAIDVVLLPPEDIMNKAIEINKQLSNDPIRLNKGNCLPHVSLFMGVVEEENLPKIKEIINKIAAQFSKLSLTISRINYEHCGFDIQKTGDLQKLHETIMTKLDNYLTNKATTDMCFSPPPVVEKTLFWINNYREISSFKKFYPHITLGISKIEGKELNIDFTASKLAICHLGNYCTCRKILHSANLV